MACVSAGWLRHFTRLHSAHPNPVIVTVIWLNPVILFNMQRFHADNNRNESQIDFVIGNCKEYDSAREFYAAAIRLLWEGWDSDQNTEKYIANSVQTERTIVELTKIVNECLVITPIVEFSPNFKDIESVQSFRDDWNVREFVWLTGDQYVFMSWDTAA